jgi:hypothetical protein
MVMKLVGFNARQVEERLTRRGDGKRTRKLNSPSYPVCAFTVSLPISVLVRISFCALGSVLALLDGFILISKYQVE